MDCYIVTCTTFGRRTTLLWEPSSWQQGCKKQNPLCQKCKADKGSGVDRILNLLASPSAKRAAIQISLCLSGSFVIIFPVLSKRNVSHVLTSDFVSIIR